MQAISKNKNAILQGIRNTRLSSKSRLKFCLWAPVLLLGSNIGLAAENDQINGKELTLEEVLVTARRKDETLQEVPVSVAVVTADAIDKLNIRKLEDLQSVVAGLTLEEDSIAPNSSLRGVRFDTFASGFNPTVEFYLNDAPIVSLAAIQALFDVGQIEVLRGPQGTLRGRASPSGAITITTQRPDLVDFGGYVDLTSSSNGGGNAKAAVNIPLIEEKLALRFAAFHEENNGNGVRSINSETSSSYQGDGYRVSLRAEPIEALSVNLMYQRIEPDRQTFFQVESANIADPSQPASPRTIHSDERLAVTNYPERASQDMERYGLELAFDLGEFILNYSGSKTDMAVNRKTPYGSGGDLGDFFDASYNQAALDNLGQVISTNTSGESHEFRIATDEPLAGKYSVIAGILYQENSSANDVFNPTALFAQALSPQSFAGVTTTPIVSATDSKEKSVFANVTWDLTEVDELSLGVRYITFETTSTVDVTSQGVTNRISNFDEDWSESIYLLSYRHQYNEDLMAYVTAGSSWRPGISAVGDFSVTPSAREKSFITLEPETSDSIEFGVKSTWLDRRLNLNASAFYQQFDNYPYRAGGNGIYYITTSTRDGQNFTDSVDQFNFVSAVPINVYGIEVESAYQASEQLSVGALFSYSKGEIDNGTVACNDYSPADGQPDSGGNPSVADIRNGTGGDTVGACNASYRSNNAPLWTSTLTSEYSFPFIDVEAYIRGLVTFYGNSENDPANPIDDVDAYNTINGYAGIRDPEGKWELMFYGKNLADTESVIHREASPATADYQVLQFNGQGQVVGAQAGTGVTSYRQIGMNAQREFGINLRYNF